MHQSPFGQLFEAFVRLFLYVSRYHECVWFLVSGSGQQDSGRIRRGGTRLTPLIGSLYKGLLQDDSHVPLTINIFRIKLIKTLITLKLN